MENNIKKGYEKSLIVEDFTIMTLLKILRSRLIMIISLVLIAVVGLLIYYSGYIPLYESEVVIDLGKQRELSRIENSLVGQSGVNVYGNFEFGVPESLFKASIEMLDLNNYTDHDGRLYADIPGIVNDISAHLKIVNSSDRDSLKIKFSHYNPLFTRDFLHEFSKLFITYIEGLIYESQSRYLEKILSQIESNTTYMQEALDLVDFYRLNEEREQTPQASQLNNTGLSNIQKKITLLKEELVSVKGESKNLYNELFLHLQDIPTYEQILNDSEILSLLERFEVETMNSITISFDDLLLPFYFDFESSIKNNQGNESLADFRRAISERMEQLLHYPKENFDVFHGQLSKLSMFYQSQIILELQLKFFMSLEKDFNSSNMFPLQSMITLHDLYKTVEYYRNINSWLSVIYATVKESSKADSTSISIIVNERIPVNPINQRSNRLFIIGVFLAFGFSCFMALLLEIIDGTLKDEETFRRMTRFSVPILGSIPLWKFSKKKDMPKLPELIVYNETKNIEVEKYRILAKTISATLTKESKNVISITSVGIGEGCTLSAVNIGIELVRNGKKVLILDANVHRPRLENIFKLPKKEAGLFQCILNDSDWKNHIIQPLPDMKNIYFLPVGNELPESSSLFYHPRYHEIIEQVSKEFDVVLIDSPSYLYASDLLAVVQSTQGSILVTRAGITSRKELGELIQNIEAIQIPLIGMILNGLLFIPSKARYQNIQQKFNTRIYRGFFSYRTLYRRDLKLLKKVQ